MITELEIEGFKSFSAPGVQLKLDPLNFVVGANATGKSNLLAALRFLQNAVVQDVDVAVRELGGASEVRNRKLRERRTPKPVRIRLKLDQRSEVRVLGGEAWTLDSFDYEMILDLRSHEDSPIVDSESLQVSMSHRRKKSPFQLSRTREKVIIIDPSRSETPQEIPVPKQETARLALGVGFFSVPCAVLRSIISRWRFFNVSPRIAREPCRELPDADLGSGGENLAVVLHKIEQIRENNNGAERDWNAIVAALRGVIPGFKGFKTTQLPVEGKWAFQINEDRIPGAINPSSVSDGTIRLLTLMVITNWTAQHSSFVAIEEPENGVHPQLSEHIVEILRTASQNCQFLVTTHNPRFLDFLEPSEVILCDKADGCTRMRRACEVADLSAFQKRFQLGELWLQGTLGGIP